MFHLNKERPVWSGSNKRWVIVPDSRFHRPLHDRSSSRRDRLWSIAMPWCCSRQVDSNSSNPYFPRQQESYHLETWFVFGRWISLVSKKSEEQGRWIDGKYSIISKSSSDGSEFSLGSFVKCENGLSEASRLVSFVRRRRLSSMIWTNRKPALVVRQN